MINSIIFYNHKIERALSRKSYGTSLNKENGLRKESNNGTYSLYIYIYRNFINISYIIIEYFTGQVLFVMQAGYKKYKIHK